MTDHRHGRSSARVVIGIINLPLWGHFLRQPIQSVIGSRNRRRKGPTRILLLHLRDSISPVTSIVRAGPVLEGHLRTTIKRVVGVDRHLALLVGQRRQIAIIVVRMGFGV